MLPIKKSKSIIKEVEIYRNDEAEIPLHAITFNFPVYKDGKEVNKILWDNGNTVETCVLLTKHVPQTYITEKVEFGRGEGKIPIEKIAKK